MTSTLHGAAQSNKYSVAHYESTSDPTVNDDLDLGFQVGSVWVNTSGGKIWMATSVADGAAVWKDITSGGGTAVYGSCYGEEIAWVQSSAVQNTWYEISDTDMTDGVLSGVTHDGSGKLTVGTTGTYLVSYDVTFEVSTANKHMETAISIGGSEQAQGQSHLENATANLEMHCGSSAVLSLSASDTIEVSIRYTDVGATNITVDDLVITATLIGSAGASVPQAFPVGAIYINITGTNPATELGYGTWSAFGAGRVLVGYDSGDADFDAAEETGGAKTVAAAGSNAAEASHTHSVTSNVAVSDHSDHVHSGSADHSSHVHSGSADHASHTHTYTEVPNHVHVENVNTATTGSSGTGFGGGSDTSTSGGPAATWVSTANPTGGVATGTTAGPSAALTHGNTGNNTAALTHGNTGNNTATLSHSVTNNAVTSGSGSSHNHAFTGSSTSVVQPYIVCHFWKRTA